MPTFLPGQPQHADDRGSSSHPPEHAVETPGENHDHDGNEQHNRQEPKAEDHPLLLRLGQVAPAASAGAGLLIG